MVFWFWMLYGICCCYKNTLKIIWLALYNIRTVHTFFFNELYALLELFVCVSVCECVLRAVSMSGVSFLFLWLTLYGLGHTSLTKWSLQIWWYFESGPNKTSEWILNQFSLTKLFNTRNSLFSEWLHVRRSTKRRRTYCRPGWLARAHRAGGLHPKKKKTLKNLRRAGFILLLLLLLFASYCLAVCANVRIVFICL